MILTVVSHGRTCRDAANLTAHLLKPVGQQVRVIASRGLTPGLSLGESLADLRRMSAASKKAAVGFHHVTINPARSWKGPQAEEAVRRVLSELGAESHAWTLVEHSEKQRASGNADTHFHLVVAHVGPDGRALRMSQSFARLEAVARTLEADFGEAITRSRRPAAVTRCLSRMGRGDVIASVAAAANPAERPRSAMSSQGRQRAARLGIDLPPARAAVMAAWASPGDIVSALEFSGLRIATGDKRGVVILKTGAGEIVGALDRLAGVSRAAMRERLEADMARKKKEQTNEREARPRARRDSAASVSARKGDLAGSRQDAGGHHDNHRPVDASRGIAGPRRIVSHRGETRHAAVDPAAALRRRRRALIEQRQADAAAKKREEGGRSVADDVQGVKALLWRQMFGVDLSDDLIHALLYVDVQERLVRLIGAGWVRDAGDTIYASGADPVVVAVMVEAAKAKGWQSVRVWGSQAFVNEARRQFEAAGISVRVGEAPPPAVVQRPDDPALRQRDELAARLAADFRRRRDEAAAMLEKLQQAVEAPTELRLAIQKEKELDAAWRAALRKRKEACVARDAAKSAMEEAGFLARVKARREFEAARCAVPAAQEALDAAVDSHERARDRADDLKRSHAETERNRLAENAGAQALARKSMAIATACLAELDAHPELAWKGKQGVEEAAMQRLAAEAAERAARLLAEENEQRSGFTGP